MIGLALAKLAANQRIMNVDVRRVRRADADDLRLRCHLRRTQRRPARRSTRTTRWFPTSPPAGFLYGTVLLYLVGVETPFNMGAEFLSVKRSATKMIGYGSAALIAIYLLTTIGTMMVLPGDQIDPVTGVIGNLDTSGFPGLMEVAAVVLAVIVFVALVTYQVAYSRLIFVSGLERHLPRIFTHLNPRTRNPVTAVLIQGVLSSLIIVALYSQSSMANVTVYLQGGLSVVWLISGFFFFVPLVIARKKYADRYASEDFWRIPGGMPAVWAVVGDRHRRDLRGHLLLVRLAVDRRSGEHVDDLGRRHRGGDVRPRLRSCTSSADGRPPRSARKTHWHIWQFSS